MTNARDKANIPVLNFQSKGIDDNADATAITINSSEQVGFGTVSPDHLVHISASSSNAQLKLQRTGSATATYNISASSDGLAFSNQVTGSEVMRITSTGLGIGSSAPTRKLHIVSSDNQLARFESTDTYGGIELCDNTSGTAKPLISAVANDFVFYRGGSSHTVAFGATSVGFGVGTASPSRALTVSGSTAPILALVETGTSGSSSVFFGDSGADNIGKIQYLHSSNDLAFTVNASERMRITSAGLVGIGTSSPGANLEISSGSYGSSNHHQQWSYNGTPFLSLYMDAYASPYFDTDSASAWNPGATMVFKRQGSEKMRITSDGKIGIGTTSPDDKFHVMRSDSGGTAVGGSVITAENSGNCFVTFLGTNAANCTLFFGDNNNNNAGQLDYDHANDSMSFYTNQAEKMRITSNGNVLFSTTSTPNTVVGSSGAGMAYEANGFLGIARIGATLILNRRNTHGDNAVFRFDGNNTGSISVTSNTTAYNTSSDYRLKENVSYDFDATTRLKQLKPARFNFISDADKTVDGFLAHEVSSIVPEAINGTKDAVDEDGNPEYQGIDQSKLVPLLVKTIQELEARITTLEANNP